MLVKPEIAQKQIEAERAEQAPPFQDKENGDPGVGDTGRTSPGDSLGNAGTHGAKPRRFYGTATLDTTRVGRDAGRIAEEVIAHLSGLVGAKVTVTLEIAAEVSDGVPDQVVRIVTENSRTLKFTSQGFEKE